MKNILKLILSAVFLFAAVPTVNAMDMNMAGMEEVKKKKLESLPGKIRPFLSTIRLFLS